MRIASESKCKTDRERSDEQEKSLRPVLSRASAEVGAGVCNLLNFAGIKFNTTRSIGLLHTGKQHANPYSYDPALVITLAYRPKPAGARRHMYVVVKYRQPKT